MISWKNEMNSSQITYLTRSLFFPLKSCLERTLSVELWLRNIRILVICVVHVIVSRIQGFQFLLIKDLWGISFHDVVVFGLKVRCINYWNLEFMNFWNYDVINSDNEYVVLRDSRLVFDRNSNRNAWGILQSVGFSDRYSCSCHT